MPGSSTPLSRLIHRGQVFLRFVSIRSGFFWRGLGALTLSTILLLSDELGTYDRRFQMRGEKPLHSRIVVVTIEKEDLSFGPRIADQFSSIKDIFETTDSFYWDPTLWRDLLDKILEQAPTKVGVTLFFSDQLVAPNLQARENQVFQDPRVIWAGVSTQMDRPIFPLLANYDRSNVGTIDLIRDEDGVVRRFSPARVEVPHFVEMLLDRKIPAKVINYQGISDSVMEVTASTVRNRALPADFFRDKIVIIGGAHTAAASYLTPFGPASRQMVVAQIADNTLADRWVRRLPIAIYIFGLFLVLYLTIYIVSRFPQAVAALILVWVGTLIAALSMWVFDTFSIWIPVISPLVQIFTTWVLFIGYQANRIERRNFELQQEQKYIQELEQLKNNFVSLISHDLKTPIAKIQAIVDRLMADPAHEGLKGDFLALRVSGEELNRYIQSILKILRIESRDFKLNLDVADVNQLAEDVVMQLKPLARERGITLKTELEPLFSMELDTTLIREVILNLAENAIKYTPTGGQVTLRSREEDAQVRFEVADTGEGIPADELPHVWGKFVRGKDQNLKTKGSGLGLYLVKYFIELHGGSVKIDSELGKGTKVQFSLPIEATA